MKKLLLLILLCAVLVTTSVLVLAGCSSTVLPSVAWGDYEKLTFDVTENNVKIGEMTLVSEADRRNLGGFSLNDGSPAGNTKTTVTVKIDGKEGYTAEIVANSYTVVAFSKAYTNDLDATKNYSIKGRLSGKNFIYSIDGGSERKIKTGKTGFTVPEFIYNYFRCYPSGSFPAIKVIDFHSNTLIPISASAGGQTKLSLNYPNSPLRETDCTVTKVALSSSPTGEPIYVWYSPEAESFWLVDTDNRSQSRTMPVRIQENNLIYTLTGMSAKKGN